MERAVEIVVSGVVQGVAFRWHASGQAERLGLRGWVRNEPDGTVRLRAEGSADAVEQYVAWCHQGPRWASVERVQVRDVEPKGYAGFEITG